MTAAAIWLQAGRWSGKSGIAASQRRLTAKQASFHSTAANSSARPAEDSPRARKKVTLKTLQHRYITQTPITMLTAYDYSSARFIEQAEIDVCLVGDSLAMVACGYQTTNEIGMDEMLYHCRAVSRGAKTPLRIGDMPFGSHQPSLEVGITNAIRMLREGGMEAIKIEGGMDAVPIISKLVDLGIPVMGHVGLMPQRQSALSGYRVQGKTAEAAMRLVKEALAVQEAGAFAMIVEAVPAQVAEKLTTTLSIPTISIGAGAGCSGQVLVTHDMLGMTDRVPRFCKTFGEIGKATVEAISRYREEVRNKTFPDSVQNTYEMPPEEWQRFLELHSDFEKSIAR